LALKCLLALHYLDQDYPTLHVQSFRVRQLLQNSSKDMSQNLLDILKSQAKTLFSPDTRIADWNNDFLNRHKASAPHIQAGLRVRALIRKGAEEEDESDLLATLSLDSTTLQDAKAGLELMNDWSSSAEARNAYKKAAAEPWTRASAFQPEQI
jgi:N-alpha-acetyltransferase 15/16, NatA auxiliary subunit